MKWLVVTMMSAVLLQGQAPKGPGVATAPPTTTVVNVDAPDAQRTRDELNRLMERYPPTVRQVLSLDPSLLVNPGYLAPYPALSNFLITHPDVLRNPSYYFPSNDRRFQRDRDPQEFWHEVMGGLAVFAGFGMAIGLLTWLIRTLIDYRRWSRLAKVQSDVHAKLMDRFGSNEDLMAYIKSPAGSRFLESAPIPLDAGPRSMGAPLGRIMWSVQVGVVLIALGLGLFVVVGASTSPEAAQALHGMGVLGFALGAGFVVSAIISYAISNKLGLLEPPPVRNDPPGMPG